MRTSASIVADQRASSLHMQQHFGFKNVGMMLEYVSTLKVAMENVATELTFPEKK